MDLFVQGAEIVLGNSAAQTQLASRVGQAVQRLGWPVAVALQARVLVEMTMRELPAVLAQTSSAATLMLPQALPALQLLAQRLAEPLPANPATVADEMLRRSYTGLRVLALIPGALSPQGVFNLLMLYDVLGEQEAQWLDGQIVSSFPGTFLLPIPVVAAQLRALLTQVQANPVRHPIYGNVTTEEVVRLELGRHGIV
jgi:hypothetical protein